MLFLFWCSVMSDSLQPHGLQHARLPCPSPSPGACSNSCPVSWWCHPTILSSVIPFSARLQTLSQHQGLFHWGGFLHQWPKCWSCSFSISPSNEYSGLIFFRIDGFDLLAVQGTLKNLLQYHSSKASVLQHSSFLMVQLSHLLMTTGKNHSFDYMDLYWKSDISALYMLSRLVIGEGDGTPLQYSCLENPMDGGAW